MFGIQSTDLEFEYLGYQYRTYRDVEEDNIKLFHLCFKDGKEVSINREFYNTSPYRRVRPEDFKRYIDEEILLDFVNS